MTRQATKIAARSLRNHIMRAAPIVLARRNGTSYANTSYTRYKTEYQAAYVLTKPDKYLDDIRFFQYCTTFSMSYDTDTVYLITSACTSDDAFAKCRRQVQNPILKALSGEVTPRAYKNQTCFHTTRIIPGLSRLLL